MYPPCGTYNDSYDKDMSIVRTKTQWSLLVAFLAFIFAFPFLPFVSGYIVSVLIDIAIVLIAVQGINIVTGYCGQITLGQAGFVMIGAYTSAIISNELGLSFWIALPVAGITATLLGLFFALPAVRVKGLYLALATLAAQFIIMWTLRYVPEMFGLIWGAAGLRAPAPMLGSISLGSTTAFYYLAMSISVLMVFFAKSIVRSGLGRAFVAVRDNDKAAEAIGINIFYYKLIAFGICSFYGGIAGSLSAHYASWIGAESFHLMDSVWWIGMAIIGGLGSTVGPIFGVILLTILRQFMMIMGPKMEVSVPFLAPGAESGLIVLAFGVVILLFLLYEPRGLAHRWGIFKSQYRLWPFAY